MASWLSGSVSRASRQMLSASPGSFKSRYRSALARARGTASGERLFNSNCMATSKCRNASIRTAEHPEHLRDGVVELIDDALLQRNDRVVGDRDALGAYLGATLRDVAVPNAVVIAQ